MILTRIFQKILLLAFGKKVKVCLIVSLISLPKLKVVKMLQFSFQNSFELFTIIFIYFILLLYSKCMISQIILNTV